MCKVFICGQSIRCGADLIDWTTIIGLAASALTTIAYIPEVVKTVTRRHTRDLSLSWIVMLDVGQLFWLIYGNAISSLPLIIAAGSSIVMMTILLIDKLRYKNK